MSKVVDAVLSGLSVYALTRFVAGRPDDPIVSSLDGIIKSLLSLGQSREEAKIIQMICSLSRALCSAPRGPSLFLDQTLGRLVNCAANYIHPRDPHVTVITRKRAANCVLTLCRKLYDDRANHGFMATVLLPGLIKCVAGTRYDTRIYNIYINTIESCSWRP